MPQKIKLSELVHEIQDTFQSRFEGETFWITTQIIDVKKQEGVRRCYLKFIEKESIDLITATFVFNELNYCGLIFLLSEVHRILKKGGHLYLRDSLVLKDHLHDLDYDGILKKIGYKQTATIPYKSRLDLYGIPRVYEKISNENLSFDLMVDTFIGKYASVALGKRSPSGICNP